MLSGFDSAWAETGTWLTTLAGHSKPAALCHLQAVASDGPNASTAFLLASAVIVEPHPLHLPIPGQANQNYQQDWEDAITHQIGLELPCLGLCLNAWTTKMWLWRSLPNTSFQDVELVEV